MTPKIHNPADLTPEARLAIERKQFNQLLPLMHAQYLKWQLECDFIYGDSPPGVKRVTYDLDFNTSSDFEVPWKDLLGYQLSKGELASLITSDVAEESEARPTMHPKLLDAYITMICKHVNQVRSGSIGNVSEPDKQGRNRGRSRSPASEPANLIRVRSPRLPRKADANENEVDRRRKKNIFPSCKIISGEAYQDCWTQTGEEILDEEALDKLLKDINCTPENFRELDYLFIPIVHYGHALLIGFAPKQKYAFFLDSESFTFPAAQDHWFGQGLMIIIHKLDPTIKFTDKNIPVADRTKYWYLFGQYPKRSKTDDGSPDGPQQSDKSNCGIFAMTSAFCLAFGYNLLCWEQSNKPGRRQDLDKWKKARILFEMENGEFSAEHDFEYDLLEIPTKEIQPTSRPTEDPISSESELSNPECLHPYDDLTPPHEGDSVDEDRGQGGDGDDNDDYDLQEAFAIETEDLDSGYGTDEGDEGSDGDVDEEAEADACRAFLTASEALTRESPKVQPISDDLPWPSQIPSESKGYFTRSGFIYPPPDVNFQPELKYSKRELKKACRDFPLVGWKRWSRQSQSIFLQWMLNEMAATMSLIHRDPIKPFEQLGRGFELWKPQHAAFELAAVLQERRKRQRQANQKKIKY